MGSFTLNQGQTALLIVDMQDKIFSCVERGPEILATLFKLVQGCQILNIPILITEQHPNGLGHTIEPLQHLLGNEYYPWIKSTFSALNDHTFAHYVSTLPYSQWIVVGIEAHICVLQTVKSLLQQGKQVAVLNDAIASRSIYDFSTAIAEMRDDGARITSSETALFELLKDSSHPQFKAISQLIKSCCQCSI